MDPKPGRDLKEHVWEKKKGKTTTWKRADEVGGAERKDRVPKGQK